jgi:hypothetical protein
VQHTRHALSADSVAVTRTCHHTHRVFNEHICALVKHKVDVGPIVQSGALQLLVIVDVKAERPATTRPRIRVPTTALQDAARAARQHHSLDNMKPRSNTNARAPCSTAARSVAYFATACATGDASNETRQPDKQSSQAGCSSFTHM